MSKFKEYLERSGNSAGLDYINGLEAAGHKLTVKGGGCILYAVVESVYGYNVFYSDKNKEAYASLLQTSSAIGEAAATLAYCIVDGAAHVLVKGDDKTTALAYLNVVNTTYEKQYDDGESPVGYPFRSELIAKEISGKSALWNALSTIHGYSPVSVDSYPYNSYGMLMQGRSIANLILGIELNLVNPDVFAAKLLENIEYKEYYPSGRKERYKTVLEDLKKRYVYPYGRTSEDVLMMVMGEASARSGVPYKKVATQMHCYKNRHDLTVGTLASLMIRRKCTYDQATTLLGMGSENPNNLLIETFAELNRLTGYSYEYIVKRMLCVDDKEYGLLVRTFRLLHQAYGWSFAELCQKYHIVRDAIYIGSLCGF